MAQATEDYATAKVATAKVAANKHLLAGCPPYVLFVGAGILELLVAGVAWGLGAPRTPKPERRVYVTNNIESVAKPRPASDMGEVLPPRSHSKLRSLTRVNGFRHDDRVVR